MVSIYRTTELVDKVVGRIVEAGGRVKMEMEDCHCPLFSSGFAASFHVLQLVFGPRTFRNCRKFLLLTPLLRRELRRCRGAGQHDQLSLFENSPDLVVPAAQNTLVSVTAHTSNSLDLNTAAP
jgi:hypothetical protein